MCCSNSWSMIGALLAGLGVILGAYAAHGLDGYLVKKYGSETRKVAGREVPAAQKYLTDFKTGTTYQMYHALGLIAVGILAQTRRKWSLQIAAWCFLAGIVLFCGALYVIALAGPALAGNHLGAGRPVRGRLVYRRLARVRDRGLSLRSQFQSRDGNSPAQLARQRHVPIGWQFQGRRRRSAPIRFS